MASTSAESYFDKVPLEIFLAIVKEIPDIPSLTNCMGLSKSIRKRLIHDLPSTCRAVITNEIGSDFLPIAVSRFAAEHETSGLPRILAAYKENPTDTLVTAEYEDCAIRFFEKYLRGQAMNLISPPSGFTLDTAQALSRFHEVVWDLVDRIINKLSPLLPKSDSLPITPVERARLCRALYIHELSRLVVPFQHEADGARRGLYKKFWKCFAPWENQQVYCVWRVLEELMFDYVQVFTRHVNKRKEEFKLIRSDDCMAFRRLLVHQGLQATQHLLSSTTVTDAHLAALTYYSTAQGTLYGVYTCILRTSLWFSSGDPARPGLSFNMPNILKEYREFGDDSGTIEGYFYLQMGTNCRLKDGHRFERWIVASIRSTRARVNLFWRNHHSFFSRERWDLVSDLLPTMEELIDETSVWYMDDAGRDCRVDE